MTAGDGALSRSVRERDSLSSSGSILWRPSRDRVERSQLTAFAAAVGAHSGRRFADYDDLWRWSVESLDDFWSAVVRFYGVEFDEPYNAVLANRSMPGATWFPGGRINFAKRILDRRGAGAALITVGESRATATLSWDDLAACVGALSQTLLEAGVRPGDRVVAYLPNIAEAVVGLLACASVGAIWAICGPEVGPSSALSRFAQLAPVVLLAVDGCRFSGRLHDRRGVAAQIADGLPSVHTVIHVPLVGAARETAHLRLGDQRRVLTWDDAVSRPAAPCTIPVDASAPLWVAYSSGTTGVPKGLVHSHAGILVVSLAQLGLQYDVGADDRFFWHSSTTWVMWNAVVSSLLLGATGVVYDGSPLWPHADRLWSLAEEVGATVIGASPAYVTASDRADLSPGSEYDLSRLRAVGITGAPLPASSYRWLYENVSEDMALHVISGGTDFAAALFCDAPWLPVTAGEMSARALGVNAQAWDAGGAPVVDEVGELVVLDPIPSMPLAIWGDEDGSRYRESYFDTFPGVWRHGDWVTITSRGTAMVHGRSDSTINRHGVRMGSSEIYAAVEAMDEIEDSLVLGVELDDGRYWMPLFVKPAADVNLDAELVEAIRDRIRQHASPRHLPDEVIAVPGVPRTVTGKKLEVPLKRIAQGASPASVLSLDAIDDPDVARWFIDRLTRATRGDTEA
jgi:acetoacetyl-CoA synthetase